MSRTPWTKVFPQGLAASQLLRSGRAMLDSVRVRLTLWYTAVLAVVLVALSFITYFIFWQSTVQRTDANLAELSNAFLTTLDAEIKDQRCPYAFKLAGQVAITEHLFRDHVFAIFDAQGNLAVSSQDVPLAAPAIDSVPAGLLSSQSFQRFLGASSRTERFFGMVRGNKAGYRAFARRAPRGSRNRFRAGRTFIIAVVSTISRSFFPQSLKRSEEHTSELQSRQYLVCRL